MNYKEVLENQIKTLEGIQTKTCRGATYESELSLSSMVATSNAIRDIIATIQDYNLT